MKSSIIKGISLIPVGIAFNELFGSFMFIDGRSMQPTLNPDHDGYVFTLCPNV